MESREFAENVRVLKAQVAGRTESSALTKKWREILNEEHPIVIERFAGDFAEAGEKIGDGERVSLRALYVQNDFSGVHHDRPVAKIQC